MKRGTMIGAIVAGAVVLVAGAAALAVGGHHGRHGMIKRVVAAEIDEVLDQAQASPEQRAVVHGARDRVFAAMEEHWRNRPARLEEALALFEADQIDPVRVADLRRRAEDDHRRVADAVSQAIGEVHAALTPEQRRIVADYVRSHRRHRRP
jgi:uncharacterized membrane protein